MTTRSFFDLATGVCVMRPELKDVPPALAKILEFGSDDDVRNAFGSPQRHIPAKFRGPYWNIDTHLHEAIHFWQSLRYPFVFWNSLHSWRFLLELFVELNRSVPNLHDWTRPAPRGLGLMTERFWIYRSADKIACRASPGTEYSGWQTFKPASALDLLETAVSLTQWRFSVPSERRTPAAFSLWAKRTSSYPEMLQWLSKLVENDDLALDIFLPLCHAAFETTNPIRGFAEMANLYARRHGNTFSRDPLKMRAHIRLLLAEITMAEPSGWKGIDTLNTPLAEIPFYRMGQSQVINMKFGRHNWPHPTLHASARHWTEQASNQQDLRYALEYPERDTVTRCYHLFQPLIIARYDFPTRTRVVPIGDMSELDLIKLVEEAAPGSSGSASFVDLYMAFGAVRRATGAFYAQDVRLCPHFGCPEYKHNYCNSWIFIHPSHHDCRFREHFDWLRSSFIAVQDEMERERSMARRS